MGCAISFFPRRSITSDLNSGGCHDSTTTTISIVPFSVIKHIFFFFSIYNLHMSFIIFVSNNLSPPLTLGFDF
uniref:Uncharacterized protein n=1 Tax=Setaria viridis TaxID=4556 RepID=A0A4U6UYV0_SETVI|nr:hypothetical protein SEVIR_4G097001v2 [Setaria viridis]